MQLIADGFDVWVFRRRGDAVEYLLLRASAAKASRWFGGGQFWQVPSDFARGEAIEASIRRELARYGLTPRSIWVAENTYTFYSRRYRDVVHISVFAAEVTGDDPITLDEGHDDYAWVPGDVAFDRVSFRGLVEGLRSVVDYVTEREPPLPELRLA